MTRDSKWNQIKQNFSEALELEGEERQKYLQHACRGEPELLKEVQSLLDAHDKPGPLDQSLENVRRTVLSGMDLQQIKGKQIGPYRIVDELGRGGMGSVFLAERADGQFDQKVALKVLHAGVTTENQLRRFTAERQILASLSHTHIATLLDGGVTGEGQLWFVMEYVDGVPIDRHCDEHRLSIEQRLKLFLEVCNAVQYAHRQLVVHRDLKPSNILVTKDGTVKLLDFGIAKVLNPDDPAGDQARLTQTGLLPLTPAYASPEQIRGETISTASDVYQLGLVLYELLTGCRPYEVTGRTPSEIEKIICEEDPTRPSTALTTMIALEGKPVITPEQISHFRNASPGQLQKWLRGDLDTIVLKALRKEPDRRYYSAEHLSGDLKRYLAGKPVLAHPDSWTYRTQKFIHRNRWAAVAVSLVVLSLVAGTGLALWQAGEARLAAAQAETEAERATAALIEAEQALGRAEALQDFLLELFQATSLDRPRDRLPSTEEILALGAERAMDRDAAPPAERFGMLTSIARVYVGHGRHEDAEPLIDEAVDLAQRDQTLPSHYLARALELQASLIIDTRGSLEHAEALLTEAESIVEVEDHTWELFARIRNTRAWINQISGNYEQGLILTEPLFEQMNRRSHVDPDIEVSILNRLALLHLRAGSLEEASRFQAMMLEVSMQHHGPESREYTVGLANSIGVEAELGRFEVAEARAREAIALYDRIYEGPVERRAAARSNLARVLFLTGRFDEAFEELEKSSLEWASALDQKLDDYSPFFHDRGSWFMHLNQPEKAIQDLTRSRELIVDQGGRDDRRLITRDILLAMAVCRQGDSREGEAILAEMMERFGEIEPDNPRIRAQLHEARARCYFESGNPDNALPEIEKSLAAIEYPGLAMERSERKLLLAEILKEQGQMSEAARQIELAEQLYLDVGLSDHPMLGNVEAARQKLIAESQQN